MEKALDLSVHQLVDFLLRTGDIDNRIYNKTSMNEGTRLHASYQRRQDSDYHAEYFLTHTFLVDDFKVTLSGRADGVIERPFLVTIDEIKTSVIDNEEFYNSQKEWHLGQAKIYALIYALDHKLSTIGVRLTYINQLNDKQLIKEFKYTLEELEEFCENLIKEYLDFYQKVFELKEIRNETSKDLTFPFLTFRPGQFELAKYTFSTLSKGQTLFVEAPTGIGKTISTLYPAIKTFAEETNDKIFYLTAKNSGIESAFAAVKLLLEHGLKAKVIQITAKDKICACLGRGCNPDECPFAKGYYQKIMPAIKETLNIDEPYDRELLSALAQKYEICPFEFQLDLSLFCDLVVCDFNYLFDPIVYMRRYFDTSTTQYVALVDEAHNLVERGRDMYSTSLSYMHFKEMRKSLKKLEYKPLKSAINKINKIFKNYDLETSEGYNLQDDLDNKLLISLTNFQKASSSYMKKFPFEVPESFKEFFFEAIRFLKISEFFSGEFRYVIYKEKKEILASILNLNPAQLLKESLSLLRGAVLFSATLSPLDYYVEMLGGDSDSPVLKIPSPFPPENLKVMVAPNVSTTYKKRQETLEVVANYIKTCVKQKVGNYFIFFPSYKYLESVLSYFEDCDFIIHKQVMNMSEIDKKNFLDNFVNNPSETHLGFVVLGGAFSEGIDLIDDRLIGAIIVGVGLPQISFERDLIKDYFATHEENGFAYAYVKPGMNRVIQAVGRVIRSEKDKGIVLLMDERYLHRQYHDLFKSEWQNYEVVLSENDLKETLKNFYKNR